MQSNGSAIGARLARDEPVRTILSGPAAGVIGAAALVARNRRRSLHHFRHGRHFDRRVAVRRPRRYPHAQLSRRLRRPHSCDRHPHRGRRRRLDRGSRRRRLAQGRSRKRRRRSGASLLWTRRRRPPLPTRTWSPGAWWRRIFSAARCGFIPRAQPKRSPRFPCDAHRRDRRGQRCDPRRQRQHGTRGARHNRRARLRPARLRADGVWRGGPDARLRTGARSRHPPCRTAAQPRIALRVGRVAGAARTRILAHRARDLAQLSAGSPRVRHRCSPGRGANSPPRARAARKSASSFLPTCATAGNPTKSRCRSPRASPPISTRPIAAPSATPRPTPRSKSSICACALPRPAPSPHPRALRARVDGRAVADAPNPGRHRRSAPHAVPALRARRDRRGRQDSRTGDRGRTERHRLCRARVHACAPTASATCIWRPKMKRQR